MKSEIVKPFIEALNMIVSGGADPKAVVQKLKKFRELDEEQRLQLKVKEAQINSGGRVSVKKREEVLKELEKNKYANRKSRKIKKNRREKTKAVDSKKEEKEYDEKLGLQNCFHLIVDFPEPEIVSYFLKQKVDYDLPDQYLRTPFNLLSINGGSFDIVGI